MGWGTVPPQAFPQWGGGHSSTLHLTHRLVDSRTPLF
jgi:hypothetical protein